MQMTAHEQAQKIIAKYRGEICELDDLMNMRRILSCAGFEIGKSIAESSEKFNSNHALRKIRFFKLKGHYLSEGHNGVKSENMAFNDPEHQKYYKAEYDNKGIYDGQRIIYDSIKKTLESMTQDIAELRRERDHQRELQTHDGRATNIHDKNGKEIFAGDEMLLVFGPNDSHTGIVKMENGTWIIGEARFPLWSMARHGTITKSKRGNDGKT